MRTAVASSLFSAIERGDIDAVRALYHPDAVIWHNTDGLEQGVDANLAVLRWCVRNIVGMRYEDVRCHETPTGFVEQHVLRGLAPDGTEVVAPGCLVVEVADGLIIRIDEYLDGADLAALMR